MDQVEGFGACLSRCLKEAGMSATEAAKLVGFRSRNSIFRILAGETSVDVSMRFLSSLYDALKDEWPQERWVELQEALRKERLGEERYRAHQAFSEVLYAKEERIPSYTVHREEEDGGQKEFALADLLEDLTQSARVEIVITGCCESGISRLLEKCCSAAGERGTLKIRHYIDTDKRFVTQNILGILPLVGKPWYNARLVEPTACPVPMWSIYRLHALHICRWDENGQQDGLMLLRYDDLQFSWYTHTSGSFPAVSVLDRLRFDLELLKPMPQMESGPEAFVAYTAQCAALERDCTICSIKPDIHFPCIPAELLEQAVLEGFEQSGLAAGEELKELIAVLKKIHVDRYVNMADKHKPTHLVYSLQAMERFMRTGVQSDHFFIQRAYTVEERRTVLRTLLELMQTRPWFNVYFLKENAPLLQNEITFFEGRGVLLMDAYTNYELNDEHSEAVISLPVFMESFQRYFMDELLQHHVVSREDTIRIMESMLVMNVQE